MEERRDKKVKNRNEQGGYLCFDSTGAEEMRRANAANAGKIACLDSPCSYPLTLRRRKLVTVSEYAEWAHRAEPTEGVTSFYKA